MSFFSYNGKKIFYETQGDGKPLVFLHGNTSSSKLFKPMLPLYKDFQVILIDFLGYGRSDRLKKFPVELWKEEARQTIALLDEWRCLGSDQCSISQTRSDRDSHSG